MQPPLSAVRGGSGTPSTLVSSTHSSPSISCKRQRMQSCRPSSLGFICQDIVCSSGYSAFGGWRQTQDGGTTEACFHVWGRRVSGADNTLIAITPFIHHLTLSARHNDCTNVRNMDSSGVSAAPMSTGGQRPTRFMRIFRYAPRYIFFHCSRGRGAPGVNNEVIEFGSRCHRRGIDGIRLASGSRPGHPPGPGSLC